MKLKTLVGIAGLAWSLALLTQTQVYAENLMQEGIQYYNSSNFGKAENAFKAEITAHPKNADAHYMLGNALAELNREKEAVQEYNLSLSLEPNGVISSYCKKALSTILNKHVSPPPGHTSEPLPVSKPISLDGSPPGSPEKSRRDTENQAVSDSASKISAQTNETEAHASEECEARIRDINRDTERQIADLQREQQERIDANIPAMAVKAAYRAYQSADDRATREEIARKIEAIKTLQAKRIAELHLSYKIRQSAAEDAALTLDKQYANRDKPANVKLSPTGTSIYVRSYETSNEPSGNSVPVALPPAKSLGAADPKASMHKDIKKAP
ncbi:MAG: tetratricopeptide repeat protein [Cyanobacteria bacterium SZAS-4]|nr:tetratricopeptide repeat protein [Cyanobacteria bacterium SZAS-4]